MSPYNGRLGLLTNLPLLSTYECSASNENTMTVRVSGWTGCDSSSMSSPDARRICCIKREKGIDADRPIGFDIPGDGLLYPM